MQTGKGDPRPALAGLKISWGNDEDYELAPASTLSGQLLVRGSIPAFLNVGAAVGLVDPATSRCLFAGSLEPLTAVPDPNIDGAWRVSFTAASPQAELEKARVLDMDWPHDEPATGRRTRLASAMPRGWTLSGSAGWNWIHTGHQKYQSVGYLTLLDRYVRGYLQRYSDTSAYVPGTGLVKRLTITNERPQSATFPAPDPTATRGNWRSLSGATGVAVIPASAVDRDMVWEKTPADVITDVQVTTFGGFYVEEDGESGEFEYLMSAYVDNSALQARYGQRSRRVETSLSPYNPTATAEAIRHIVSHWLNTDTAWRPTTLSLPDSRVLNTNVLANLLAVDTRHMAAVQVYDTAPNMPTIGAFVLGGDATWTGKKWETQLTLGRTL